MRGWSQAWLETTGVTAVSLERPQDGAEGDAVLVQSATRPHRLKIGLYDLQDGVLALRAQHDVELAGERTPIDLPVADPTLINDADLTYVKARLDDTSLDTAERSLSTLSDPLARALVWSSLWNATRDGELATARYLRIARAHAPAESDSALLGGVLLNAAFAIESFVPVADRAAERRAWIETVWAALGAAEPASDAQLAWARALAIAAAVDDVRHADVRALLDGDAPDGLPLDPDLRWALLTALVTTEHADLAEIEDEHGRDRTASGQTAAIEASASRTSTEVRDAAWAAAWEDEALSNDHLDATFRGFRAGGRRDLVMAHDAEYFARIREAWATRSIEIAKRLVIGLFPSTDTTDAVDAWLAGNEDAPAALRRLVVEQQDHLRRQLRVRSAQPRL